MNEQGPRDRLSVVVAADDEYEVSPDHLAQEMVDWAVVLRKVGGSVSFMSEREEIAPEMLPGMYSTVKVWVRWKSGNPPPKRRVEAAPEPEPEPVADPVPAFVGDQLEPEPVAG